jgi:hypothetical protein
MKMMMRVLFLVVAVICIGTCSARFTKGNNIISMQ